MRRDQLDDPEVTVQPISPSNGMGDAVVIDSFFVLVAVALEGLTNQLALVFAVRNRV